jgi:HEAT repeat protein
MKRRTKWLIVCALSLLGMVASIFLATPRQPRYQGRSLDDWLVDVSHPHYETQRVARAAIQAMGPEAVPFLTNALAQREALSTKIYRKNFIPRRLATWARRFVKWQTPMMESRSAAVALQFLGPQATNAIPALIAALQDPNWAVAQSAAVALAAVGTNAVPALGERLDQADVEELRWALQAVAALGTNAAPLVPQLARLAVSTNNGRPGDAAYGLARIGEPAVHSIIEMLSTTNVEVQVRLLTTLQQIGPTSVTATNEIFKLMRSPNPTVRLHARYAYAATIPARDVEVPHWLEGLRDPDSTNVLVSLQYLSRHPAAVHAHNREIAGLLNHPTNSIAIAASNALTTWRAWPK